MSSLIGEYVNIMTMMTEQKIGFIGLGRMASAIIKGIISSGFMPKENILAFDTNQDALKYGAKNLDITPVASIEELMAKSSIVLIATKPFVIKNVLDEIKDKIRNHLIISILAGVSLKVYENNLPNTRVVRVMPNTPALISEGMSAICKGTYAHDYDAEFVHNMFSKLGKAIYIEEKDIDIVTAISGSGPAFYYYIIEKIANAGKMLGLDYETALTLSAQTALGSAKMMFETPDTPEELIRAVTTPGGCTAVGNNVLANSNIEEILFKTIKRTMEKAKKLGG